jgi:hypothetical protein
MTYESFRGTFSLHLQGQSISCIKVMQAELVGCCFVVSCSAYVLTMKIEAIYSSEMLGWLLNCIVLQLDRLQISVSVC